MTYLKLSRTNAHYRLAGIDPSMSALTVNDTTTSEK